MKPRDGILLLVAIVICLLVDLQWRHKERDKVPETNIATSSAASPQTTAKSNSSGLTNKEAQSMQLPTEAQQVAQYKEKLGQAMQEKNVPLDFYGKVIDQDSNSLPGVSIHVQVRHWQIEPLSASVPVDLVTDAGGIFHVSGVTGDAFDLEGIEKHGYEPESMRRSYPAVQGSQQEPIPFKMWRTDIYEKLISGSKPFHVNPDGRPYYVSFADDSISESGPGDLKLWINYAAQSTTDGKQDWSCKLEVPKGGLLQETNKGTAMYSAPIDGYMPSFEHQQRIKNGQTGSTGQIRFYLKLNDGKEYGRMVIELIAPFNDNVPGLVRLDYAINPSGSRILH